jgi:hypothetical protein
VIAWKRWLKYAKARVDSAVGSADRELDRKEAELEARNAGKPWLSSDRESPTFDDVKARIEHETPPADPKGPKVQPTKPDVPPSGDPAFDLAVQQKAAAERLAGIRESLGLEGDDAKPPSRPSS